jgi:uncharacterized protein YaeQ
MAIGASIYKAKLTLSNFNDHFYHDFSLTMAKHPSENEERMMNRLVSFCLCADPELAFTKGLSTQEEPELWLKDLSGNILHWVELGQPDDKRIRQAAGKSKKVTIFTTHPTTSEVWFDKIKDKVPQDRVQVIKLSIFENGPLDKLVTKTMDLNCTIEDDLLYIANDNERIGVKFTKL